MVKLYADGADMAEMLTMASNPLIKGFTTNPSLCRKAGVKDYAEWGKAVCVTFPDYPISIEVIADDLDMMEQQARVIAEWGPNVYVKIPVTNTRGDSTHDLISKLSQARIKVNVTAVMDWRQIRLVLSMLFHGTPAIVSIFAGRLCDTGNMDVPALMRCAVDQVKLDRRQNVEILWASPRQVLDVYLAEREGVDIITITKDILAKLPLRGKDPRDYSLDTVKMFYDDAQASGFTL